MKAAQVRIARPTDKLKQIVEFYNKALGMPIIGAFTGHNGYDGVMLGIHGSTTHLEFTQHVDGSPCPAPTKDNLLVLYYATDEEHTGAVNLIESYGHKAVKPENPYWGNTSFTYEDPYGWRVVLVNGVFE